MPDLKLPVKLNDKYTCQGFDADGESVTFDDLLWEGERVATRVIGDDHFGPWGVVQRQADGLSIIPCGCEVALPPPGSDSLATRWDTSKCSIHGNEEATS